MSHRSRITLDPSDAIDAGGLGRLQWTVITLCAMCLLLDGFDVQSIGFIAPAIAQEFGVKPAALGAVFSAGLFGMVIGSSVFSLASDRFGRRPMLIAATLLSGVAMLLTARVNGVSQLLVARLLTGVGLGGLMPNALALTSEYIPRQIRTKAVMIMAGGLTLGAALGGWLVALVLPTWGWRGVFDFGGVGPLMVGALMVLALPESLRLMVLKKAPQEKINRVLKWVYPEWRANAGYELVMNEPSDTSVSPVQLFRGRRGATTILLWTAAFMCLLDLYFLSNWLPSIVRSAGYTLQIAVVVGTLLQVGGVLGTLGMAALIGRASLGRILSAALMVAAFSIFMVSQLLGSLPALMAAVFISGFCVVGGQPGLNAFAADYYPTFIRSTGLGWMLGIGRFGSIAGPLIGGFILQAGWGITAMFSFAAIPAVIACGCLWVIAAERAAPTNSHPVADSKSGCGRVH